MAIVVTHTKVSTIPDGDDTTLIRPSDWNETHTLVGLGTAAELNAGVANGVATLDGTGKVPVSELPAAVLGALSYQGTWNASTNTPTLTSSVGTKGYYYVVSVAGSTDLNGITDWQVGDWAVYNGTAWQKVDNTDAGGDVVGPASATDNAIARFDSTTGKLIQNSVVTMDDTGNIAGATLTSPKINEILDTNGNEILGLSPTASATDFLTVKNGIGVGVPLHVYADGPSTNIGLHIQPKGSGLVTISDGTDFNKGIRFRSSGSAASAITLLDAVSTAGHVVTLPDATTTLVGRNTTDTLTNKSISGSTNTLSNIGNASLTNSAITINGTSTSLGGSISVGTVTSVTGTAPVVSSGGTTPAISMAAANTTTDGYLTSTDWNTFNGKAPATTFTTNYVPYGQGTTTLNQSLGLQYNGTTFTTTGISTSNNLTFTGTGNRITGDFTNATLSNRLAFQTSTTNGATRMTFLPNGTGTDTALNIYNTSDQTNNSFGQFIIDSSGVVAIKSNILGTGTYLPLTMFTGGSERLRIDTSGNVGIGTSSPSGRLDVSGVPTTNGDARALIYAVDTTAFASGVGGGITFRAKYNTAGAYFDAGNIKGIKENATDGNFAGALAFTTHVNGSSPTEKMRIDSNGNVLVGLTSATAGGGVLQVSNGITFPATQSASTDVNTLDDYEEGTWTPADASGASLTFTSVTARYTKIGNVVYINAKLTYPTTADVSQAKISGLPFAPAVCANLLYGGNSTSVSANNAGQGLVDASSTTMTLVLQNNTSKTNLALSTLTLYFSGFYLV